MSLVPPLFDATITGTFLAVLLYCPDKLQSLLPTKFNRWVSSPILIASLATLFGLDVLRKANNKLSQLVTNNFQSAKFVPGDELVLITGGSSGIGLLMAQGFAKRGVKVVILDLNSPPNPLAPNIFFYKSDVTSVETVAATAAEIRKDHGDPTVVINNAGIGTLNSILGGTEKTIRSTFEVNIIAHYWMIREYLPAMIKKNHGHVVSIASMASYIVHSMNVDYCCTKAAVLAFHEGLSSELKNLYNAPKVKTTVVNPSWIRTPLIEPLITNDKWKAKVMEPDIVAETVIEQVMAGNGGQIILPRAVNIGTTIRAWPLWAQTCLRNLISHELKVVRDSLEEQQKAQEAAQEAPQEAPQ